MKHVVRCFSSKIVNGNNFDALKSHKVGKKKKVCRRDKLDVIGLTSTGKYKRQKSAAQEKFLSLQENRFRHKKLWVAMGGGGGGAVWRLAWGDSRGFKNMSIETF